jgi:hypothetical protein
MGSEIINSTLLKNYKPQSIIAKEIKVEDAAAGTSPAKRG